MKAQKICKLVRVITVPPIMALMTLSVLYLGNPAMFEGILGYLAAVAFLSVLPVLAYPIQPLVPGFKGKGRDGQRQLAMIMSVLGYILGILSAFCLSTSKELLVIYFTYLFSGVLILLFNKVLKIRASGHACGVAGPIAAISYFLGPKALFGLILLALVYWVSLKMGRHKWSELIWGSLIPVLALFLSIFLSGTL